MCAVIIGANDVTHKVLPSASIRNLTKAVETMREAGTQVVVGTCPDLGTIRPIAPPLRQVARRWSRRLAAAQAIAVVEAGGRGGLTRHHPRPGVRRRAGRDVRPGPLPPLARGLPQLRRRDAADGRRQPSGSTPTRATSYEPARGEGVFSLAKAAAYAADNTGSEVSAADVRGRHGPRSRWAVLRHRRRPAMPAEGSVETDLEDSDTHEDAPR